VVAVAEIEVGLRSNVYCLFWVMMALKAILDGRNTDASFVREK